MARGITQEQVNQAADAILGTGENPTVEKVRAELGTGSPNTITRMLDTWRSHLGDRLRQLSALPEVPASVGQVMIELWRLAAEQAGHAIEGRFAKERSELEVAQAQLEQERKTWEMHLQSAEIRVAQAQTARELAEHACNNLDGQLQDSHALRADLVQQRDRLQSQYDQQFALNESLRTQLEDLQANLQLERSRQEVHIRAVEDRSHQEVDRARKDAKQWQQRNEASERAHRDAANASQERLGSMGGQVRHLEHEVARQAGQIAALEKALSEAHAATTAKQRGKSPTQRAGRRAQPKKAVTRKRPSS